MLAVDQLMLPAGFTSLVCHILPHRDVMRLGNLQTTEHPELCMSVFNEHESHMSYGSNVSVPGHLGGIFDLNIPHRIGVIPRYGST